MIRHQPVLWIKSEVPMTGMPVGCIDLLLLKKVKNNNNMSTNHYKANKAFINVYMYVCCVWMKMCVFMYVRMYVCLMVYVQFNNLSVICQRGVIRFVFMCLDESCCCCCLGCLASPFSLDESRAAAEISSGKHRDTKHDREPSRIIHMQGQWPIFCHLLWCLSTERQRQKIPVL